MLSRLPQEDDPRLLVGRETSDDAGVVKINDDLALIQTIDFFTPMVNDPFAFGQIAAANALSDVYAMGGSPLTAMNVVCFPEGEAHSETLYQILSGGLAKIKEAGAMLVGGHSVRDNEIKYGLSVTGTIHPSRVTANANASPGQVLVLTKPLGSGILATALKKRALSPEAEADLIATMSHLNRIAAEVMVKFGVVAATDVTGFGLLGHALELAQGSKVGLVIRAGRAPYMTGAVEAVRMGMVPGGSNKNLSYCAKSVEIDPEVDKAEAVLLADAQTSGGLLMAVDQDKVDDLCTELIARGEVAAQIGRTTSDHPGRIVVEP